MDSWEDVFGGGNKERYERRIKFSKEANDFLARMESKGIPVSNLVNMLIENCVPSFGNKGYTEDGIINVFNRRKYK